MEFKQNIFNRNSFHPDFSSTVILSELSNPWKLSDAIKKALVKGISFARFKPKKLNHKKHFPNP